MKAPVSWLRSLVDLPQGVTTTQIAHAFTTHTAAVERVESTTEGISGPVVIGRVLSVSIEPQKNGKTIRYCQVDVGEDEPRGIVCGADNFVEGDLVVTALPGAELPGGFAIAARKTYGHISDGMICAEDELGIGDDHTGIIVLPDEIDGRPVVPGADALEVMGVRDEVLDIDITPDIGYALSMRGLARELAQIFDVEFDDPYLAEVPAAKQDGYPIIIEDTEGCSLFVGLTVEGVDPHAPTPAWMVNRLQAAGMRSISLSVDVTNYVMLEAGQPLHAYDADALRGPIVVRSARPGEKLTAIDHIERALDPDDLLITDDSGPIGMAGVMGGLETEISNETTNIVLEAAHFTPNRIARTFRRHNLGSEASRRFEKGVDPALPWAAANKAAELLVTYGGGTISQNATVAAGVAPQPTQTLDLTLPGRVLGMDVSADRVEQILRASGVQVERDGDKAEVTAPSWRFDLVDPYDYAEEVGRKVGFDDIPSILPIAPAGRGLTREQIARRAVLNAVVTTGFVEVMSLPFVSEDAAAAVGFEADQLVRVANPLDDTNGVMRPSLLPGLFAAVARNTSRSQDDLALAEMATVFRGSGLPGAPRPDVSARPSDDDLAAFEASLPAQPLMLAAVVTGNWLQGGWQGGATRASWVHVMALAEAAAGALGATLTRQATTADAWHPGRTAALMVDGEQIGIAGELHPATIKRFGLPAGTAALELDVDRLMALAPGAGRIAALSPFPLVKQDIALVVDESVSASELMEVVREGAGELLESIALFDIYTGPQVGEGKKSLAFNLRFRGADRTLKEAEAGAAREAAVTAAAERFGAVLRG